MDWLKRADSIQGWMSEHELEWLHNTASGKSLVMEFGSWRGRSTAALLGADKVVCVDHWQGSEGEALHHSMNASLPAYKAFTDNFVDEINDGKVVPETGDLRDLAFRVELFRKYGRQADMVFIDASHVFASVMDDIAFAQLLLKPGGVLCGHDYGVNHWADVKDVVDRLFTVEKWGSIWIAST